MGPFTPGKGQVKFLLVVVDYFTKWIEADPLTTITTQQVQKFVWRNIICRFGIPHTIITENGKQFTDAGLKDFYLGLHIKHVTSSVEHPQGNGQAEAANKVILRVKEKAGPSKGTVAGAIARSTLGIPLHATICHQGNALQPHIWNRCHDTGGNRRAVSSSAEL